MAKKVEAKYLGCIITMKFQIRLIAYYSDTVLSAVSTCAINNNLILSVGLILTSYAVSWEAGDAKQTFEYCCSFFCRLTCHYVLTWLL